MANGKKTGGRDFKKGVSGNPKGRPALPEDIKIARSLTQAELWALLNRFLFMSKDELQATLKDPTVSMLEITIGSIVAKAATGADHQRLDFLLTRLIGKAAEPGANVPQVNFNFQSMPRAQVIQMGMEAIRYLKGQGGTGE